MSTPTRVTAIPATALVALAVVAALGPGGTIKAVCAAEMRLAVGEANPARLVAAVVAAARKIAELDQSGFGHAILQAEAPVPIDAPIFVATDAPQRFTPRIALAEHLLDLPPPGC